MDDRAAFPDPQAFAQIGAPLDAALGVALREWRAVLGERLVSILLFGSAARGEWSRNSDVDLLLVVDPAPRSLADRRRPLVARWQQARRRLGLAAVQWDLVVKDRREAVQHSPLYLDMLADGILLYDRGSFLADVFARMRERMAELGSRRVYLSDGSWYWDLKPGVRFGEVVEI